MSSASIPTNETQRLAALHATKILDSARSDDFDQLTELCKLLFDVPIVAVSMVDESRQWFKSQIGLDVCETTRDVAFCAHVVAANEPVLVEDTLKDARFANNELVTGDPWIRFYSGMPIFATGGEILGTLCLIDTKPGTLSETQLKQQALLTRQAEVLVRRHQERVALSLAKEAAEKANRAKDEFLSSMSHELRTPLNSVIGYAQILLNSRKQQLEPYQKGQVEQIYKSGLHLLSLINEVLDLAKIEAGQISLAIENINLHEVAQDAVDTISSIAGQFEVSIMYNRACLADVEIVADYTRLKQVLINLLSNAVKYNRKGGQVALTWRIVDGDVDPRVQIDVVDTGVGVAPQNIELMFQPFNRLGAENSGIEGTGVGLPLTKTLVELMHGQISAESEEGVGSRFTFSLPMKSDAADMLVGSKRLTREAYE